MGTDSVSETGTPYENHPGTDGGLPTDFGDHFDFEFPAPRNPLQFSLPCFC